VNRGLSPWTKDFSQPFIDGAHPLFTLRLRRLSQMGTASFEFETPA
jgi:hypothetical protein